MIDYYRFCNMLQTRRVKALLSDQGTFTPIGAQGGSMEPPKKTTFPPEFCNEIYTIMYAL